MTEIRTTVGAARREHTIDPASCDAVVFDMDGVLTDTARLHARAWKRMFDELLERRAAARGERARPFDLDGDYARYIDGKPRYDGVRSFLASRGIELEEGENGDEAGRETVYGLGNRKNALFLELLREEGVQRLEDAIALVRELRRRGVRTAVISSSRNAPRILERAGIEGLFDARVTGVDTAERGLAGKPAPDVFLEAARAVGAEPGRSIAVEDAAAGVRAARAAGFARVIGVARRGGAERLGRAGAHVVVRDLSEIDVAGDRGGLEPT